MADLLTHVLVALVLATVLSWYVDWITPPMVAAAMAGAVLPDLNRLRRVIPSSLVETLFGIPWDWAAIHRVGGTLVLLTIVALLVHEKHRRAAFLMLLLGAASHYALDLLLFKPSGMPSPLFWPLTDYRPAIGGIYLSSDRWPALFVVPLTAVVLLVDRRLADTKPAP